jgi:hypothetical protein
MNKLEEKAAELVALGESYGYTPNTDSRANGQFVYVFYNHKLRSLISFTETGKVKVESWERDGKTINISLKNLAGYLQGYKEAEAYFEELRARISERKNKK